MANPLDRAMPTNIGTQNMIPGETRFIECRDSKGMVFRSYVITRTDRPFVYDLSDAYNDSPTEAMRENNLRYFVVGNELVLRQVKRADPRYLSWEIERNEAWLNQPGQQELRAIGLKCRALETVTNQVQFVKELR
jgi:hypothetical protein